MLKKIYNWMGSKVNSKYSTSILGFLFFIEAIAFFPVDPLLILFCLEKRDKAYFYALIATIASSFGGLASYFLGLLTWEIIGQRLVDFFQLQVAFEKAISLYKTHEILTVLLAGFTPIPYKAITLSAGFCRLPILPFIVCSIIARGSRFFLVALIIRIWGEKIKIIIDRYFNQLAILFILILILFILFFK